MNLLRSKCPNCHKPRYKYTRRVGFSNHGDEILEVCKKVSKRVRSSDGTKLTRTEFVSTDKLIMSYNVCSCSLGGN